MKSGEERSDCYVNIPESYTRRKLNALYREIPLKDSVSRTLRKYFNAMANLYGIITLGKAYEIISEQSPTLVSKEEFSSFAEIARHECEDYYILGDEDIYTDGKNVAPMDREIIDSILFDEDIELYIQTKQSQQGKPFYIPVKKQFLLYDDPFYCEATPETCAMRTFLSERFALTEEQEKAVFIDLLYGSRYLNEDFSAVPSLLHDLGLQFKNQKDMDEFIKLHQAFHNNTRLQCNRGYTPVELSDMQPVKERIPTSLTLGPNIRRALMDGSITLDEFRQSVLTMKLPSEELRFSLLKELLDFETQMRKGELNTKKVGRNEPCPCGSGKKYKRCCGK